MLALSRKVGETIVLIDRGRITKFTIIHVRGDQVRLAFEADRDVRILREELITKVPNPSRATVDEQPNGRKSAS